MKKIFEEKNLSKNWYKEWENKKYFIPNYKKEKKYCITIPPPNITGSLHMGHAFQCTLMDILIRYHKMNNFCTLWKMGTDHAGIATQILIEQKIKEAQKEIAKQMGVDIEKLDKDLEENKTILSLKKGFSSIFNQKYSCNDLTPEPLHNDTFVN